MQKINLIAQSVLELSHREKVHDDNDDDDDDNDDTHPGWIIVRDGMYSVADKNCIVENFLLTTRIYLVGLHKKLQGWETPPQ